MLEITANTLLIRATVNRAMAVNVSPGVQATPVYVHLGMRSCPDQTVQYCLKYE
jgi:hypothetical protein